MRLALCVSSLWRSWWRPPRPVRRTRGPRAQPASGVRSCPRMSVRLAKPHARAAAGVPLLQPARAELELPDGRHARRERRRARTRPALFSSRSVPPAPGQACHLGEHHGRALQGRHERLRQRERPAAPTTPASCDRTATIRITDHYNSVSAGGGTDPATVWSTFRCPSTSSAPTRPTLRSAPPARSRRSAALDIARSHTSDPSRRGDHPVRGIRWWCGRLRRDDARTPCSCVKGSSSRRTGRTLGLEARRRAAPLRG